MAIAWLCALLAATSLQEDKRAALEEEVRVLLSENLYDGAKEAVRKFGAAHQDLAGDSRVKALEKKTRELAVEADRVFSDRLSSARTFLDKDSFPEALRKAGEAAAFYPERKGQVDEFVARVHRVQASQVMVKIPSKPCWIGDPPRQVTLPAFLIDPHPVTNERYAEFLAATGAAPQRTKGRERHPVVLVTWDQAAAYATWAGKRLPTAEEWEVAARGDDRREYPWGKLFQEKEAQFNCNSLEYWQVHKSRTPGTTPVEEFTARSPFGVAMGGNVWEWTSTSVPGKIGDRPAEFRILKGGSFMTPARAIRCATALPEYPALPHPDVGFRCVKDAP